MDGVTITLEALRMIPMQALLTDASLSHTLARWVRLANLLGIAGVSTQMTLVALQHYISVRPSGDRCACRRLGLYLLEAADHWDCCPEHNWIQENDASWNDDYSRCVEFTMY